MRNPIPIDNEFARRKLNTFEHSVERQAAHCETRLSIFLFLENETTLITHPYIERNNASFRFLPHHFSNGEPCDDCFRKSLINIIKRNFFKHFAYEIPYSYVAGFVTILLNVPRTGGNFLNKFGKTALNLLVVKKALVYN